MLRGVSRWSAAKEPSSRAIEGALARARRRIVAAVQGRGVSASETATGVTLAGKRLFTRRRHDANLQWPGEQP